MLKILRILGHFIHLLICMIGMISPSHGWVKIRNLPNRTYLILHTLYLIPYTYLMQACPTQP